MKALKQQTLIWFIFLIIMIVMVASYDFGSIISQSKHILKEVMDKFGYVQHKDT